MYRFELSPIYPAITAATILGTSALLGGCSKPTSTEEVCMGIPLSAYSGSARNGIVQGVLDYTPITNLDSGTGVTSTLKGEATTEGAQMKLYQGYQERGIPTQIVDLPRRNDQIGIRVSYNKEHPNDGPIISHFPEGTRAFYSPADAEQAHPLGTKAILYNCETAEVTTYLSPKSR